MGNIYQESKFKPDIIQGNGKGPAAGLFQWENYNNKSKRWKAMRDHAASLGKDWTDLGAQLDYAYKEMSETEKWMWDSGAHSNYATVSGLDEFKKLTDPSIAAQAFENHFERAGKPVMETRVNKAIEYYNTYSGSQFTGSAPSFGSSTNSTSGNNSGFSLSSMLDNIFGKAISTVASKVAGALGGILKMISGVGDYQENHQTINDGFGGSISGETANGFPYYKQYDDRWANTAYGSSGTIKSAGCGPTAMAMVLKSYGQNVTPVDTAAWSQKNGYRIPGSGTSWAFFDAIGKTAGLTTSQFTGIDQAKQYLAQGVPVIGSMMPGDFTKGGHFLVFSGIKNDQVTVNDPASEDRTKKVWGADHALKQAKQFWAISKDGKGSLGTSDSTNVDNTIDEETVGTGSGIPIYNFTDRKYIDRQYRNISGGATGLNLNNQLAQKMIAILTIIAENTAYDKYIPEIIQALSALGNNMVSMNRNTTPKSKDIQENIDTNMARVISQLDMISQSL